MSEQATDTDAQADGSQQGNHGPASNAGLTSVSGSEQLRRPASLPQMLVESGVLSPEQVMRAQGTAQHERLPFAQVIVRDGFVLSWDLAAMIAVHMGLELIDLRTQDIQHEALALLPEEMAKRYGVLPVRMRERVLIVALTDPTDLQLLQDLTVRTGCTIEPVVDTPEHILEAIEVAYRSAQLMPEGTVSARSSLFSGRITASVLREVPPAQVLDLLMRQALQDRASDVHIAPAESRLRVRFRIDGILHDVMSLPMEMHPVLVSRLKIVAGMNVAERRQPRTVR